MAARSGQRNRSGGIQIRAELGFIWTVNGGGATRGQFDEVLGFGPLAVVPVMQAVTQLGVAKELLRDLAGQGIGDRRGALPDAVKWAAISHLEFGGWGECLGVEDDGAQN